MKTLASILLMITICLQAGSQSLLVHIIDSESSVPIPDALIIVEGANTSRYTNSTGDVFFTREDIKQIEKENKLPGMNFEDGVFLMQSKTPATVRIIDCMGQNLYSKTSTTHNFSFHDLPSSTYFLQVNYKNKNNIHRLLYHNKTLYGNTENILDKGTVTIHALKNGYESKKIKTQLTGTTSIKLTKEFVPNDDSTTTSSKDYYSIIDSKELYHKIEGVPQNPYYGNVTTVKFVYRIEDHRIFYMNVNRYNMHFDFAKAVLDYPFDHGNFNDTQYRNSQSRLYYPGTIDYHPGIDKYVLQFLAMDDINCEQILLVLNKIKNSTYFGNQLVYYPNAINNNNCDELPIINSDSLFTGQNYQCLNASETYGYLTKVEIENLNSQPPGRRDLVVLNGIPVDIPPVAGIITTEFQTPLSHLNILSINRSTPNIVLRNGWSNDTINKYLNKLVHFTSNYTNYEIEEATFDEASNFWALNTPSVQGLNDPNYEAIGIKEINNLSLANIDIVGAKAANFAELDKINRWNGSIPLPEEAFAIPFYHYKKHLNENGIDQFIDSILNDSKFKTDITVRNSLLTQLRDKIINAPLESSLRDSINLRLDTTIYKGIRFRSSTNAEDIDGFNGAGLYGSFTGKAADEENYEWAIKNVWASLWNFRAFEERSYFNIDHNKIAMGVLVHRSFPDEFANGVLITKNIYRHFLPAFVINSQFGDISVVNPKGDWQPEQVLYYTFTTDQPIHYLTTSSLKGFGRETVLSTQELYQLYIHTVDIILHYRSHNIYNPLDIEFKIVPDAKGNRILYIKQCRIFNG